MIGLLVTYCSVCYLFAAIIGYAISDPYAKVTVHGLIPFFLAPLLPIVFVAMDIVEWATPKYREVERWALSLRH